MPSVSKMVGPAKIDKQFLAGAVGLPHRALESLGELAVFLAVLGIAVGMVLRHARPGIPPRAASASYPCDAIHDVHGHNRAAREFAAAGALPVVAAPGVTSSQD